MALIESGTTTWTKRAARLCVAAAAGTLLAACQEIPQDARKPFAGENETSTAAAHGKALRERTSLQDENLRFSRSP